MRTALIVAGVALAVGTAAAGVSLNANLVSESRRAPALDWYHLSIRPPSLLGLSVGGELGLGSHVSAELRAAVVSGSALVELDSAGTYPYYHRVAEATVQGALVQGVFRGWIPVTDRGTRLGLGLGVGYQGTEAVDEYKGGSEYLEYRWRWSGFLQAFVASLHVPLTTKLGVRVEGQVPGFSTGIQKYRLEGSPRWMTNTYREFPATGSTVAVGLALNL